MGEDDAEIDTWTEGLVKSLVVYCHEPVGLYGQTQRFADGDVTSDERVERKERLLAVYDRCFRHPVVLVALEDVAGGLHASADGRSGVRVEPSDLPEEVRQGTGPEDLVMAAAFDSFLQAHRREVPLEAGA